MWTPGQRTYLFESEKQTKKEKKQQTHKTQQQNIKTYFGDFCFFKVDLFRLSHQALILKTLIRFQLIFFDEFVRSSQSCNAAVAVAGP